MTTRNEDSSLLHYFRAPSCIIPRKGKSTPNSTEKDMAVPHVDRQTFLTRVSQSGLLSPEELTALKAQLPNTNRGRLIARAMVDLGAITRFQAERLLAGRTQGFRLDQYIILEQIGQGGMGRVYKARHRTMNRIVALKVLATSLLKNERALDLFLREVHAAARLVHPHIVTAFDANKTGERYYLVMEYIDGPNLDQLVQQQGPLEVGLACDLIRQAAIGLQCAHGQHMVHRDIKPANLLIQLRGAEGEGAPGLVKISDFGLARLYQPEKNPNVSDTILTKPNTVMGTPDYLSPEQARNLHKTDIRSDLYSLGCSFYFLLSGRVPFPGGTAMEKLIRHGTEKPEPIETFRKDVPPEVSAILTKLMAKLPEDRYQEPSDLAAALEPFSVSGPTPWERPRPSGEMPLVPSVTPVSGEEAVPEELAGTVPENLSLTPIATDPLSRSRAYRESDDAARLKKTMVISSIIVFSLLILATLLHLIFG